MIWSMRSRRAVSPGNSGSCATLVVAGGLVVCELQPKLTTVAKSAAMSRADGTATKRRISFPSFTLRFQSISEHTSCRFLEPAKTGKRGRLNRTELF